MFLQKTIRKKTEVQGIGLHSGDACKLTFRPAPSDTGVWFVRRDLPNVPSLKVDAQNVGGTNLQTTLGNEHFKVATVEHCVATLSAYRIDNLFIELDGPEIPICDGSAREFMKALSEVGTVELDQPRKYCYVTEPISLSDGDKHAYVLPYHGLRLTITIDFPHPAIGRQKLDLEINEETFARELAGARTFGFAQDFEALKAKGYGLGGSLDNAIGLDERRVMNPEGLRWPDEFVRHKALDALGDLVTLGMPLMGHVVLYKAGHEMMNKLVTQIRQSRSSFRHVELGANIADLERRYQNWNLGEV